jgi:hypothetical protein
MLCLTNTFGFNSLARRSERTSANHIVMSALYFEGDLPMFSGNLAVDCSISNLDMSHVDSEAFVSKVPSGCPS